MTRSELARRADALIEARRPFVHAMVVRVQRPSSARPGDRALVMADGAIEGFVGGVCAETSVRLQSLRVLETGEPLLLRLRPGEEETTEDAEGVVTANNPCLSGGELEIFLEPHAGAADGVTAPVVAIDPICGMEVAVSDASIQLVVDGEPVYFCGDGCRDAFAASHAGG